MSISFSHCLIHALNKSVSLISFCVGFIIRSLKFSKIFRLPIQTSELTISVKTESSLGRYSEKSYLSIYGIMTSSTFSSMVFFTFPQRKAFSIASPTAFMNFSLTISLTSSEDKLSCAIFNNSSFITFSSIKF